MTQDKLAPEQRLQIAIKDALAEEFWRGKQEGRRETIEILSAIVNAPGAVMRDRAIEKAKRELAKWGV